MQKTYIITGVVLVIILAAFFWLGNGKKVDDGSDSVLTPVSRFDHSHGLAADLKDAHKLYIATHTGLYVLQNDKDLFQIGKTRDDLMGFTAHPTEAGVFFSSGHPARGGNIGFQKSADGGATWEKVSPGLNGPVDFHAMTASMVNPDVVYGFYGGRLQRSIDAGRTWEYAKGSVSPIALSSDPIRDDVVYAATENGVLVSEDGGDSWSALSPELTGGWVSVFALAKDGGRALAFSERLGGLGKSTDGGVTWERLPENFGGETVLYLALVDSTNTTSDVVYAATHQNSLYKSSDAGDTWQKIR